MKTNRIKSETNIEGNANVVRINGYLQEYACTVLDIKNALVELPDSALVYFKSDYDDDRREGEQDKASMYVIEIEEETDAAYAERMERNRINAENAQREKDERQRKRDLEEFERLKNKLSSK